MWTPSSARRAVLGIVMFGAASMFFAVFNLFAVFSNVILDDGRTDGGRATISAARLVAQCRTAATRCGSVPAMPSRAVVLGLTMPRIMEHPIMVKPHGGVALTMLVFNGKKMVSNAVKRMALADMLQAWDLPSLVMGTELNGIPGKTDVKWFLELAMALGYNAVWTQRAHSLDGRAAADANAGGGLFLLVHKRLNVSISEFSLTSFVAPNERIWLNGHLRVWRLDLKPGRGSSSTIPIPVMVTCAYIPPKGDWGTRTRPILLKTILKATEAIQSLRKMQDVYPVMMAHTNTPDGGCMLPLRLDKDRVALETEMAAMPSRPGRIQGTLVLYADGAGVEPVPSRATSKADKKGSEWTQALARNGLVSLSGVTGPRHPTSWVAQSAWPLQGPMHSVHDVIYGPPEAVWRYFQSQQGGRDVIRYQVRREAWVPDAIDHAITSARVLVWPMRPMLEGGEAEDVVEPAKPQYKLPTNGLERHKTLVAAAEDEDEYLSLHAVEAQSNDGVQLNQVVLDCLQYATERADIRDKETASEARRVEQASRRSLTVRQAVNACNVTQAALRLALKQRWAVGRTAASQAELARRRTANQVALANLRRAKQALIAARIGRAMVTDKKRMWRELDKAATDEGAARPVLCKLLECLNDKDGMMVSRNRNRIIVLLLEHRREVFAPHPHYTPDCVAALNSALVEVSAFDAEMVANPPFPPAGLAGFAADSITVLQAVDPLALTNDMDARQGYKRSLHDALMAHRIRRSPSWHRGQQVRNRFQPEVLRLEREPELGEVVAILQAVHECGNGLDKLKLMLLKMQKDGITSKTIHRLLLIVWYSGRLPEEWRKHRCLLHFKEHGSDPYDVNNYRGLGIDQIMLKILSLLMMERLEKFLTETNGLSLAQGGFQRQRGCPEQAFTLSEGVRAAIRNGAVHVVFIDIERAYDSVLHPILWERCISKGIGGLFLTTLQALYYQTTAIMDVAGELLPAVSVQCGVLQGNPLSPLLFNIYIDGAIEDLEGCCRPGVAGRSFGLPLPRVRGHGHRPWVDPRPFSSDDPDCDSADWMPCLFFADDGALMGKDLRSVQFAIDRLTHSLLDLGLRMNVRKTKWLIVAPQFMRSNAGNAQPLAYSQLRQAAVDGHESLTICGKPIENVQKFCYLGMHVNWRWNWCDAWAHAQQKANYSLHSSITAGWNQRGGSLSSRMEWAQNKILCHFNYVAATAGCGGRPSSAPWAKSKDVADSVLRAACGGSKRLHIGALRVEAGMWDPWTRIAMLQMRLWCKFLASPTNSYFYRAMCLSFACVTGPQRADPVGCNANVDEIHRQPWAQSLIAGSQAFDLFQGPGPHMPMHLWHGLVRLEADDSMMAAGGPVGFVPVLHPFDATAAEKAVGDFAAQQGALFRLVLSTVPVGAPVIDGATAWSLPVGTVYSTLFTTWTTELRLACCEALRRRANAHRQVAVRAFLQECIANDAGLRRWAYLVTASHPRAYWGTLDAGAATALLHQRLDICGTEDFLRRRPYLATRLCPAYPRLIDRLQRGCYLCDTIDGIASVRWPDTIEHVLLACSHCDMAAERQRVRETLNDFAAELGALASGLPVPDFDNDTALLIALQSCTGVGPVQVAMVAAPLAPPAVGVVATRVSALARQAAPQFLYEPAVAVATAAWVQAIQSEWRTWQRTPKLASRHETTLGFRFTSFVTAQSLGTFSLRRRLLRACAAYKNRLWDPVPAGGLAVLAAPGVPPVVVAPQGGT